jgi:hypothetical protein
MLTSAPEIRSLFQQENIYSLLRLFQNSFDIIVFRTVTIKYQSSSLERMGLLTYLFYETANHHMNVLEIVLRA